MKEMKLINTIVLAITKKKVNYLIIINEMGQGGDLDEEKLYHYLITKTLIKKERNLISEKKTK